MVALRPHRDEQEQLADLPELVPASAPFSTSTYRTQVVMRNIFDEAGSFGHDDTEERAGMRTKRSSNGGDIAMYNLHPSNYAVQIHHRITHDPSAFVGTRQQPRSTGHRVSAGILARDGAFQFPARPCARTPSRRPSAHGPDTVDLLSSVAIKCHLFPGGRPGRLYKR
jgi:hypothetical protein